ncbi:unnamed protein product [Spirodela intermedia]|uniref:Co-chaperone HscB C-terminal oligomerisation domain-containing protein n=1 Tax=Spirodela intermedia TaxID=51605 RepID=A0A7I8IKP8_SPIIN|nr:unnamed protein product [Spirodela intermedia]CAA6658450.1 unnamed protein product [Spirodela intermedia]
MWRRRVRELFTAPSPAAPTAALRQPPSLQRGLRPHGALHGVSYSAAVSPDDGGGASAASAGCWNCGAAPPSSSSEAFLVCAACGSVQPRERSYAADQSARVIDAFKTLSAPLSRAIYMVQLLLAPSIFLPSGHVAVAARGLHVDEEGTVSDPDLLAEVMELREAVEEAKDSQTLEQIKSSEKLELWSRSFEGAFKGRRFKDATASIQRMTYYQRAIEEIVKKL